MRAILFSVSIFFTLLFTGCQTNSTTYLSNDYRISAYEAEEIVSAVMRSQAAVSDISINGYTDFGDIDGTLAVVEDVYDNGDISVIATADRLWYDDPYYYDDSALTSVLYDYYYDPYDTALLAPSYTYYYDGVIDNYNFGWYTFYTEAYFYGVDGQNPFDGFMSIYNDDIEILMEVIDEYYIQITLYERGSNYAYDSFTTTWQALGF